MLALPKNMFTKNKAFGFICYYFKDYRKKICPLQLAQ